MPFFTPTFLISQSRDLTLKFEASLICCSNAFIINKVIFFQGRDDFFPFKNLTGDPDKEYIAHGLSEELLNVLAKINSIKVAGRTSSFKYKGKNEC